MERRLRTPSQATSLKYLRGEKEHTFTQKEIKEKEQKRLLNWFTNK